jgi:hypothetical protein
MPSYRTSIAPAVADCGRESQASSHAGDGNWPRWHETQASGGGPTSTFLTVDEVVFLTGRHLKTKQIQQLRAMGIPFYVNASGHAIVARAVINGARSDSYQPRWKPAVVKLETRD